MQELVRETLPITSYFFTLHTDEVEIHVAATVTRVEGGTKVEFQYALVDHMALNLGFRAVDAPPPTAVRIGLIKTWVEFEKNLAAAGS